VLDRQVVEKPLSNSTRMEDELWGGDFQHGKTSNVDLDVLFQRYLPQGLTLPCHTLPFIDRSKAEEITAKVMREGRIFFPLFIRHHWIAGVLEFSDGALTLKTYDSAPSYVVQCDLRTRLQTVFPDLKFRRGVAAVQALNSNDCGLHMISHFFSKYLGIPISPTLEGGSTDDLCAAFYSTEKPSVRQQASAHPHGGSDFVPLQGGVAAIEGAGGVSEAALVTFLNRLPDVISRSFHNAINKAGQPHFGKSGGGFSDPKTRRQGPDSASKN